SALRPDGPPRRRSAQQPFASFLVFQWRPLMNCKTFALVLPALLAACASQPPAPAPAPVPDALRPAAGEAVVTTLAARGVQIYECRVKKDNPNATEWAFVAPEAELFDANGKTVGKHYAGPP